MRLSFLFIKIIILFTIFSIYKSCLNAVDLFIKAGPIFIKEKTEFNASFGVDFEVSNKIDLDLEFSTIPFLAMRVNHLYFIQCLLLDKN